jgi:hypothetical protein
MKSRDKQLKLFLIIIGIISGVSVQFNRLAGESEKIGIELFSFYSIVSAIIFKIALYQIRKTICKIVFKSSLSPRVRELYPQYDVYTYTVFLLPLAGTAGIQFTLPVVLFIALLFVALQFFLIYLLMSPADKKDIVSSRGWLSFLFLISDFAALIYQIVWQRSLFTALGVDGLMCINLK